LPQVSAPNFASFNKSVQIEKFSDNFLRAKNFWWVIATSLSMPRRHFIQCYTHTSRSGRAVNWSPTVTLGPSAWITSIGRSSTSDNARIFHTRSNRMSSSSQRDISDVIKDFVFKAKDMAFKAKTLQKN